MSLTIEKARELLGELPKDVEENPYSQKAFLEMESYYLDHDPPLW
jgi:hypothetical protein